jgi:DNA repair protein RadC
MYNPRVPRYHISLVRETSLNVEYPKQITQSQMAALSLRELFIGADREMLAIITLDTKNKIIGLNVVSVGTLGSSLAHPREVFKMAILQNASAIIHGHNHPSGDPYPSADDQSMHKRLMASSEVIAIRVLDGIICGEKTYWSMTEGGALPYPASDTVFSE